MKGGTEFWKICVIKYQSDTKVLIWPKIMFSSTKLDSFSHKAFTMSIKLTKFRIPGSKIFYSCFYMYLHIFLKLTSKLLIKLTLLKFTFKPFSKQKKMPSICDPETWKGQKINCLELHNCLALAFNVLFVVSYIHRFSYKCKRKKKLMKKTYNKR